LGATPHIVLFVEDNLAERQAWSNALKGCAPHYTILEASTAELGLALCQNQKVDCVILDPDMPLEVGFKLLLDLIPDPTRPTIAVVVLTRLPYAYLHDVLLRVGAHAILVKQYASPDELAQVVHDAIATVAAVRPRN
jgi:DNA-binding NarL/FixJ family response regulator